MNMAGKIEQEPQTQDELECAPNHEKSSKQPISIVQLFRFSSNFDKFLITISVICALVSGICFPITITFFGKVANAFITKQLPDDEIIAIRCNGTNRTYWSDPT